MIFVSRVPLYCRSVVISLRLLPKLFGSFQSYRVGLDTHSYTTLVLHAYLTHTRTPTPREYRTHTQHTHRVSTAHTHAHSYTT